MVYIGQKTKKQKQP